MWLYIYDYYIENQRIFQIVHEKKVAVEIFLNKQNKTVIKVDETKKINGNILRHLGYKGIWGTVENFLIVILDAELVGKITLDHEKTHKIYQVSKIDVYSLENEENDCFFSDESCKKSFYSYLTRFIQQKCFYYSNTLDLTKTFQYIIKQVMINTMNNNFISRPHEIFHWNPLGDIIIGDISKICDLIFPRIIFGYLEIRSLIDETHLLISRISRERVGTRYLSRGIDEDGSVSCMVETEHLYYNKKVIFSMIQIRGSAPFFWGQSGIQIGNPRLQIMHGIEVSKHGFSKHIKRLVKAYGKIIMIDLLSKGKAEGEIQKITENLAKNWAKKQENENMLEYINIDFNRIAKRSYEDFHIKLKEKLKCIESQVGCLKIIDGKIIDSPKSVFRINCLDCLDRTNVVQSQILKDLINPSKFYENILLSEMWANNADRLSIIFTGSGALKSGFTRTGQRTIYGLFDDFGKSAQRFIQNNFMDKSKDFIIKFLSQRKKLNLEKIENRLFLGMSDQIIVNDMKKNLIEKIDLMDLSPNQISNESKLKNLKISKLTESNISILALTWNIHGHGGSKSMKDDLWTILNEIKIISEFSIIYLAFQEVVSLTGHNIIGNNRNQRNNIEEICLELVNKRFYNSNFRHYVTIQMVGILSILFVRKELVSFCSIGEKFKRKTGVGGIVGNKGTIGFRFEIFNNEFCLINSHLIHGYAKTFQRFEEIIIIYETTSFPSGRRLKDIPRIIWAGDMNFRIEKTSIADVESAILTKSGFERLKACDQAYLKFSNQLDVWSIINLKEGSINFAPTYKFIPGTKNYILGRTPGWTDRIFFRGLIPIEYNSVSVFTSDHHPVFLHLKADLDFSINKNK